MGERQKGIPSQATPWPPQAKVSDATEHDNNWQADCTTADLSTSALLTWLAQSSCILWRELLMLPEGTYTCTSSHLLLRPMNVFRLPRGAGVNLSKNWKYVIALRGEPDYGWQLSRPTMLYNTSWNHYHITDPFSGNLYHLIIAQLYVQCRKLMGLSSRRSLLVRHEQEDLKSFLAIC